MSSTVRAYADWKAPAEDGQMLIWPEPALLVEQTRGNARRLASERGVMIQNVPLAELRAEQRRWIGHGDEGPLVAMGHQIELYHPGVWSKNVLINELAGKLGGSAYHFAVDTDAPKHLVLRWPGGSIPVTDDAKLSGAQWAGLVDAPTPAHLAEVEREFSAAAGSWPFRPLVPEVLGAARRLLLESRSLTGVLTNAIHEAEWGLGLRHHALLMSPVWESWPYLAFAHHILARADSFAVQYNAVLGAYRKETGIRSEGRPWPDLRRTPLFCEGPFWLDSLDSGERLRAGVAMGHGRWRLKLADGDFVLDAKRPGRQAAEELGRFLAANGCRLAPRALTLTMFLRLMVADQFVHGIGGGRYDQITDRVVERFLGMTPPGFAVTTATMLFPTAAGGKRVQIEPLVLEGRRMRHGALNGSKLELVRRISEAPRGSAERRRLFFEMHAGLARFVREDPRYSEWERRLESARQAQRQEKDLFDRELFFAIQPEQRLRGVIERYRERLAV
jgi:hypothetical protein